MNSKLCVLVVVAGSLVSESHSASILFDLRDVSAESEIESGLYTRAGVVMSISSFTDQVAQGELNQTTNSFGVNIKDVGGELSQLIDGGVSNEGIAFSFDHGGSALTINLGSYTAGDELTVSKNNGVIGLTSSNSFTIANSFSAGDVFKIQHASGNGLSFDSVETMTVPEPSSALLLGFGGLALLVHRKRNQD